ncbi:hypothetical protein DH2020_027412 [Rehmannia glutinosa]|uniref:GRF-type domain-containing protein n=1 Tax=Rehmannia glutinosa TaxID=99300 RepID=A0ABR0VV71_REHGL
MSHVTGFVECYCGRTAVIRTAWTTENPGRRFQSCRDYDKGGCKFFSWEDPPMCSRAKAIIPGLLRKINAFEAENKGLLRRIDELEAENLKLKRKNLKFAIVVLIPLLVLICQWVCKVVYGKHIEGDNLKMIL